MSETRSHNSPSPLAGEGLGRGGKAASAAEKTLGSARDRHAWLLERAKWMRANPTDAEARLWSILRAKRFAGLKWRHQVLFDDRYIADFVCFEHQLIVEADGGQHSDSDVDPERDAWFAEQGFRVLHFWNDEILTNEDGVAASILVAIGVFCAADAALPLSPTPLPQGERGLGGASLPDPHPPTASRRAPPSPLQGEGLIGASHA